MSVCIRFEIWLQLGFYAITLYDAFDLCCRCVFLKVKAPFTILNFIINFVPFFFMKSNIWELEILVKVSAFFVRFSLFRMGKYE